MILHPSCVRVCSRNFSKMHCYRISEPLQQCELGNQSAERVFVDTALGIRFSVCVCVIMHDRKVMGSNLTAARVAYPALTSDLYVFVFVDTLDDPDVQNPPASKDNQSSSSSDTGKDIMCMKLF